MKAPSLTVVRMLISPGSGDGTNKFTVSSFSSGIWKANPISTKVFCIWWVSSGFYVLQDFCCIIRITSGGQKPSNSGQIIYELYEGNPVNLHHPLVKSLVPPKISLSLRPSG